REAQAFQRRADRCDVEAGRGGDAGSRADPPRRDFRADLLSLEEAVRGAPDRPSAPVEAPAGGERSAEEARRRAPARRGDAHRRTAKKVVKPSPKRCVVDHLKASHQVSERRACALVRQARSVYHYRSRRDPRTEVRARMREIAAARVRYGYRKIRVMLQ